MSTQNERDTSSANAAQQGTDEGQKKSNQPGSPQTQPGKEDPSRKSGGDQPGQPGKGAPSQPDKSRHDDNERQGQPGQGGNDQRGKQQESQGGHQ